MTKQKLYNRELRKIKKRFPKDIKIEKKKFSFGLLNELFDKYHLKEFCETYYDNQEDKDTWYEVEGEKYGWIHVGTNKNKIHDKLKEHVMGILHSKHLKHELYKRNIYQFEIEDFVWIIIPLSDITTYDISMIFTKNKDRLGLFG